MGLVRVVLLGLVLVGCASPRPATTEQPLTLEDEVDQYVQSFGGSEGQYRIILQAACPELENLLQGAIGRMETETEHSPEWREALGYANAINSRQVDIDC